MFAYRNVAGHQRTCCTPLGPASSSSAGSGIFFPFFGRACSISLPLSSSVSSSRRRLPAPVPAPAAPALRLSWRRVPMPLPPPAKISSSESELIVVVVVVPVPGFRFIYLPRPPSKPSRPSDPAELTRTAHTRNVLDTGPSPPLRNSLRPRPPSPAPQKKKTSEPTFFFFLFFSTRQSRSKFRPISALLRVHSALQRWRTVPRPVTHCLRSESGTLNPFCRVKKRLDVTDREEAGRTKMATLRSAQRDRQRERERPMMSCGDGGRERESRTAVMPGAAPRGESDIAR